MDSDDKSVFSRILDGELPGSIAYREAEVAVILDYRPANRGHALIVPTQPARRLAELPPAVWARMAVLAQAVARVLAEKTSCGGVNLLMCDGPIAGMEVEHVHLHVIPRVEGDGIRFRLNGRKARRGALDRMAAVLGEALREG